MKVEDFPMGCLVRVKNSATGKRAEPADIVKKNPKIRWQDYVWVKYSFRDDDEPAVAGYFPHQLERIPMSRCAECNMDLFTLDYLCRKCRDD